jgi:hypothetical protein
MKLKNAIVTSKALDSFSECMVKQTLFL